MALLNSNPPEEKLQKFIEQNPILLHQFPANKLFSKPPILTFSTLTSPLLRPKKN
jgi:hypothetical protein